MLSLSARLTFSVSSSKAAFNFEASFSTSFTTSFTLLVKELQERERKAAIQYNVSSSHTLSTTNKLIFLIR